ncbi:carbohydrate sulfotransferase 11 [Megalopta genalis]|uniref:carbohydrate sulfotransferase 11 n=1 Tax=Megalopta genalis TaxID=115081 RepID=UPI00144337BC|nr:carbohydrate sulfotransferase 11-like [Megalopta genalis]
MFRNRRKIERTLKYILGCGLFIVIVRLTILRVGEEDRPVATLEELSKLMVEAEADNFKRLARVTNTCKNYNLGSYRDPNKPAIFKHPPAPQYAVFYITRSHNLSYCPIYKAGSTTWIYNLCLLMNVREDELNSGKEQISAIARRVIPELEYPEAEKALRGTKKLLVVRHPFERLLSAYRDKLENSVAGREHGTLHFYRKYGGKIVQKYREKNFTRPRDDQVIRQYGVPAPNGIEPTFREFVEYLIHTDLASYGDDHWMPYYLFCTPCLVDYEIIAKVETLRRDQIYAIHKFGLQKLIKPRWRHSGGHLNASKVYFSQLSPNMVEKLYEKFKLDFDLFDYSPDVYYRYATGPSLRQ